MLADDADLWAAAGEGYLYSIGTFIAGHQMS